MTIIFSTHRMEEVEMISDNIWLNNKGQMVLGGNLKQIKNQYGKNTIVVDYEGNLTGIQEFSLVDKVDDYGKYVEIRLKEQADPQEILNNLVGKVRINKFEVREPSLNAIFIDIVGDKNAQNTVSH